MKKVVLPLSVLAVAALVAGHAQAQSFDRVKQGPGSTAGKVVGISVDQVVVEQTAGLKKEVPVNTITGIVFVGEPRELTTARINISNGRFEDGREELGKIDLAEVQRDEVKQDIQFYLALCEARLALGGAADVKKAKDLMLKFVADNRTSYHFYEACELLGDLSVVGGEYADAEKYYGPIGKAPWPDYRMKAGVLVGRALQAQKKHPEAIARFDSVLQQGGDSPEAARQALGATLGKAVSLSETGKVEEAIKMVNQVIAEAGPEEAELHARAYNALGTCHQKAKQTKDALLAYLHVDLLYYSFPEAHAEALANLSKLWETVGKGDRAREAGMLLKDRYPNSTWARQ